MNEDINALILTKEWWMLAWQKDDVKSRDEWWMNDRWKNEEWKNLDMEVGW
jgi:hypothetical protein